jgi:5-methylcytosine-specific restriction endonuclease McrA
MRSVRAEFPKKVREQGWERCYDKEEDDGRCEDCGQLFAKRTPEYHHIIAAALGGLGILDNLLVLCPPCHRIRTKVENVPIFKAKATEEKRKGIRRSSYQWSKRTINQSRGQ